MRNKCNLQVTPMFVIFLWIQIYQILSPSFFFHVHLLPNQVSMDLTLKILF